MKTEDLQARKETRDESSKVLWALLARAQKAYDEAKKQANIVYTETEKHAVDQQAKEEAHQAYKEAVKQAEKVRDAIKNQAKVVFAGAWEQAEKDYREEVSSKGVEIISSDELLTMDIPDE
jgi:predicted translin family RNA/ssDNA-binding protein